MIRANLLVEQTPGATPTPPSPTPVPPSATPVGSVTPDPAGGPPEEPSIRPDATPGEPPVSPTTTFGGPTGISDDPTPAPGGGTGGEATPALGGVVRVTSVTHSSGGSGSILDGGTFRLTNSTTGTEIESFLLSLGDPTGIAVLELECRAGDVTRVASAPPAAADTRISFAPPLVLPAGGEMECNLRVLAAGGASATANTVVLAGFSPARLLGLALLVFAGASARGGRATLRFLLFGIVMVSASCSDGSSGSGSPITLTEIRASTASGPVTYEGLPARLSTIRIR